MTTPSQHPAPSLPGLSGLTVIARGGYSTVYRARQDSMGREVALKIDTRTLDDERDRRRFLREAEAAGRMSGHPHIVHVYDAGVTADNHPYLVMELCTGGSYSVKVKKTGPLNAIEARDLGVKIADALEAAHRAGILHRDVKPGNILINRYGVAGLADFGLAAVFDASRDMSVTVEALTPAYAAPEVFRLERPTHTGDIYSLGATLYALLFGRPPRWPSTGSPSPVQMVILHNQPLADIPGVPASLMAVLRKAMATDPANRYTSAGQMRDALAALQLGNGAVPVEQAPTAPRTASPMPGNSTSLSQISGGNSHAFTGNQSTSNNAFNQSTGSWPVVYPSSGAPISYTPTPVVVSGQQIEHHNPHPSFDQPSGRAPNSRRPILIGTLMSLLVVLTALTIVAGVLATQQKNNNSAGPQDTNPANMSGLPSKDDPCQLETQLTTCPTEPECFNKIDVNGAGTASADRVDCSTPHMWETFAVSELPPEVNETKYPQVKSVPYIKALCSKDNLGITLQKADTQDWKVDVLPPTRAKLSTGERTFKCLAGQGPDNKLTDSYFVRKNSSN